MTPVSCAIVIAIPCALVSPLKALFVVTPDWSGTRVPYAPDGRPPLAFITETAQFAGAITVPASLMLLGASFARLKVGVRRGAAHSGALQMAGASTYSHCRNDSGEKYVCIATALIAVVVLPVFGMCVAERLWS